MPDEAENLTFRRLSAEFDVSVEAVRTAFEALRHGNGTMAQLSHADFGGMAQWSAGGMSMVGDMFNAETKRKFDGVMNALSKDFTSIDTKVSRSRVHSEDTDPCVTGSGRWPSAWGEPSSEGSQNDMKYAFFPRVKRLAIQERGKLTVYDTGEHYILGISQQQGSGGDIRFHSQIGPVTLSGLNILDTSA